MTQLLRTFYQLSLLASFLFISQLSLAQDPFGNHSEPEFLDVEEAYKVTTNLESKNNQSFLSLNWTAEEGYYLYQHQFKLVVKNATQGFEIPLTLAPGKKKFDEYFDRELEVYYKSTSMSAQIPQLSLPYEISIQSQGCADAGLCYPPHKYFFRVESPNEVLPVDALTFTDVDVISIEPEIAAGTQAAPAEAEDVFIPYIMLLAILGGLILNLMPCVFPVLSLKALSFASQSQADSKSHKAHGWAYTAGAVGSFALIAIIILVAQSAGESLGWGFQLQNPVFVGFLVYLFFVMGLILSGFVTLAGGWMGWGQNLTSGDGLQASFFTGILAAVVASPCSGPFMATALGIAITQPPIVGLLIFSCLGFGMALPFLLLSYNPKLINLLPAPGVWMDTLKQFFSYPLFATGIWLLWVLGRQINVDAAILVLSGCLLICFGVWLSMRSPSSTIGKGIKTLSVLGMFILAISFALKTPSLRDGPEFAWVGYTPAKLEKLRQSNTPVFIDLTADWCITCKLNERVALNKADVHAKAKQLGIVMMKGDWTNEDPAITELLAEYGRNGVPLYLMYPNNGTEKAQVLPQILTKGAVLKAMEESVQ